MHNGRDGDWDSFDFETWGEGGDEDETASPASLTSPDGARDGLNGNDTHAERGGWERSGGRVFWEESEEADEGDERSIRAEASSVWAADDVDIPLGAPDSARVRAVRAWLLRRRALESREVGSLLLERRESGEEEPETPHDASDMQLLLAARQAALEEYDSLFDLLDRLRAHSGPQQVLVEFYLALTERLAALASVPEAPDEVRHNPLLAVASDEAAPAMPEHPPTPRSIAEWEGRYEVVMLARRRVEQVSAPEPED